MKTAAIIFWGVLFGGIFAVDCFARSNSSDNHVLSPDEAIDLALMYTGLGNIGEAGIENRIRISAVRETAKDTTSDYAGRFINDATTWRVMFENVILNSNHILPEIRKAPIINFMILINEKSKKLLQIVGVDSESNICIASTDVLVEAAVPFKTFGEKYHGLPDMPPQIDFLTALDSSNCRVSEANIITAVYVLYSYDRSRYRQYEGDTIDVIVPAWVIQIENLPPWSIHGTKPEYTNQRVVIDGRNGKRIVNAFSFTNKGR